MKREGTEPFKKMSERITWVDVARGIAAISLVSRYWVSLKKLENL